MKGGHRHNGWMDACMAADQGPRWQEAGVKEGGLEKHFRKCKEAGWKIVQQAERRAHGVLKQQRPLQAATGSASCMAWHAEPNANRRRSSSSLRAGGLPPRVDGCSASASLEGPARWLGEGHTAIGPRPLHHPRDAQCCKQATAWETCRGTMTNWPLGHQPTRRRVPAKGLDPTTRMLHGA